MTYQVSITVNVEADDLKEAALEGYKAIMGTHEITNITLSVRDPSGVS